MAVAVGQKRLHTEKISSIACDSSSYVCIAVKVVDRAAAVVCTITIGTNLGATFCL